MSSIEISSCNTDEHATLNKSCEEVLFTLNNSFSNDEKPDTSFLSCMGKRKAQWSTESFEKESENKKTCIFNTNSTSQNSSLGKKS